MQNTYERTLNKFVAIILIMVLTLADIITIGLNFASLAIDIVATSSNNVEFEAYFKGENGEKIKEKEEALTTEKISMYVEISVVREGYFNGKMTMQDSNLQIVDVAENPFVNSFEADAITFNQINSGKKVTIEMQVKPKMDLGLNVSMLDKNNVLKIEGTYTSSNGAKKIEGTTNLRMKFVTPSDTISLLDSSILSNKIYSLEGVNKRIIQILVKSKIKDNIYPTRQSTLDIKLPIDVESAEVVARSTSATNKNIIFSKNNYVFNKEKAYLQINLENNEDENGNISFEKKAKDEFVVTCIYPENKEFKEDITVLQNIITYDHKELKANVTTTIEKEKDGIVNYEVYMQESEIYKGKIYSGEERTYKTNVRSYVNSLKVEKKIEIALEKTDYLIGETKKLSKISYKEITIKKQEFAKVLGENGFITLKDENGTVFENITKESTTDENGNIVITIPQNTYKFYVESSKVEAVGKIDFIISKAILENEYTQDEIKGFTGIENKVVANTEEITNQITLKETVTEAKLEVNTNTLKAGENENVQLRVTLLTNDESKDLYKNPTIKIVFPEDAKEVTAKYKMLYSNGLEKNTAVIKDEDNKKVLEINLQGEQETYPGQVIDGTDIIVNANIKMSKSIAGKNETISMSYQNENANGYVGDGIVLRSLGVVEGSGSQMESQTPNGTENNSIGENGTGENRTIEDKDVKVEMKIYGVENDSMIVSNFTYKTYVKITNDSTSDLENVKVRFFPNEYLKPNGKKNQDFSDDNSIIVSKIKAGETEFVNFYVECLGKIQNVDYSTIYAIAEVNGNKFTTNTVRESVKDMSGAIDVKGYSENQTEGNVVEAGEKIFYIINVKNTGGEDMENLEVQDSISKLLKIKSVTLNGSNVQYDTDEDGDFNKIVIKTSLKAYQTCEIKVDTIVDKEALVAAQTEPKPFPDTPITSENDIKNNKIVIKNFVRAYNGDYDFSGTLADDFYPNELSKEAIEEEQQKDDNEKDGIDSYKEDEDIINQNDGEDSKEDEQQDDLNEKDISKDATELKYKITGKVWLDEKKLGYKLSDGKRVSGINVFLINPENGDKVKNENGDIISAETSENGEYILEKISKGKYIVAFEYDAEKYSVTEYQKQGIEESINSDALSKNIKIDGKEINVAATDILNIDKNLSNIDLGLIEIKKFDLELSKTINKVTVSNNKETKTYEFNNTELAKVEFDSKYINGTNIQIEYVIKIKNNGDVAGYAKNIVDYLPVDLSFDEKINSNWYLDNNYLYNKSLANVKINPGETEEVRLVLSKNMTEDSTGLISNIAEIAEAYDEQGNMDADSNVANRKEGEDDMGKADIILGIKTGNVMSYVLLSILLIGFVAIGIKVIINDNRDF